MRLLAFASSTRPPKILAGEQDALRDAEKWLDTRDAETASVATDPTRDPED